MKHTARMSMIIFVSVGMAHCATRSQSTTIGGKHSYQETDMVTSPRAPLMTSGGTAAGAGSPSATPYSYPDEKKAQSVPLYIDTSLAAKPIPTPELNPANADDFDTQSRPNGPRMSAAAVIPWPLSGRVTSTYGRRGRDHHSGIDISAKRGTQILSPKAGVVEFAGRQGGYGYTIVVDHGGFKTLYGHLSALILRRGAKVSEGTTLGRVGTSGNATGPHLHFEYLLKDGAKVDPLAYLAKNRIVAQAKPVPLPKIAAKKSSQRLAAVGTSKKSSRSKAKIR